MQEETIEVSYPWDDAKKIIKEDMTKWERTIGALVDGDPAKPDNVMSWETFKEQELFDQFKKGLVPSKEDCVYCKFHHDNAGKTQIEKLEKTIVGFGNSMPLPGAYGDLLMCSMNIKEEIMKQLFSKDGELLEPAEVINPATDAVAKTIYNQLLGDETRRTRMYEFSKVGQKLEWSGKCSARRKNSKHFQYYKNPLGFSDCMNPFGDVYWSHLDHIPDDASDEPIMLLYVDTGEVGGSWHCIDGIHRLAKAFRDNVPFKIITVEAIQ